MKNNENLVDLLDLCADLFAFPQTTWCERYQKLGEFANGEFAEFFEKPSNLKFKNLKSPNLDEIISNYINYFDLNSLKFQTSLMAGIWLDNKIFGVSYDEICKFYESCGYKVEKNCDHISNLIAFCAILAEESEFENLNKFCKFLTWFGDLRINLAKFPNLIEFEFILSFTEFLISNLQRSNNDSKC